MAVSEKWNSFLKEQRSQEETDVTLITWNDEHPHGTIVATQERFHQELLENMAVVMKVMEILINIPNYGIKSLPF
jgi:hypothetical protein